MGNYLPRMECVLGSCWGRFSRDCPVGRTASPGPCTRFGSSTPVAGTRSWTWRCTSGAVGSCPVEDVVEGSLARSCWACTGVE